MSTERPSTAATTARFADTAVHRQAHRVLMGAFYGLELPDWMLARLGAGLGSICLFGSNLTGDDAQARDLIAQLHAAAPEGTLITLDEEGGDVTRLDAVRGSEVAGAAVLGAVDDPALTYAVATRLGNRLRDVGIDLDLGPVADVNCEPDNQVIGVRSFGAAPDLVARHVAAFVDGLQRTGVAACVKHFPGHGATVEDSHLAAPRLDVDATTLRTRELAPFAAAARAGTAAVMTSHVVVTALDPKLPATTSPTLIGLLRDELGYDGVLVSDALDMAGVALLYGGSPAAAVASLAAGADLLCLGPDRPGEDLEQVTADVIEAIVTAVQEGALTPGRLAEAAGRVDRLIAQIRSGRLSSAQASPGDGEPDVDPNPVAARRALWIEYADGTPSPVPVAAVVVEFDVTPGIAAGVVPWGLAGPLDRLLRGVERRVAREGDTSEQVLDHLRAAGPDRPVIAVVRDAHRHPWVAQQLAELAAARPDLTAVETGWPVVDDRGRPTGLPGATRIWTYGGSAVSLRAAAEVLAGLEAPDPPRGTSGPAPSDSDPVSTPNKGNP